MQLDYCCVRSGRSGDITATVLVGTLRPSGFCVATVVREKGPGDQHAIRVILGWLAEVRIAGELRLRTNGEQAISALADLVAQRRRPPTLVEISSVSGGDLCGAAERSCQAIAGVARTLCLALGELWGEQILVQHPLFAWLVSHAAWIINRFQKHHGDVTPFEMVMHKPFQSPIYEFGSVVMARHDAAGRPSRSGGKWTMGLWLGVRQDSCEYIVGTVRGIMTCRSVKLVARADWPRDILRRMRYPPWSPQEAVLDPRSPPSEAIARQSADVGSARAASAASAGDTGIRSRPGQINPREKQRSVQSLGTGWTHRWLSGVCWQRRGETTTQPRVPESSAGLGDAIS